jgi:DNA mismatch repair protein MutS
MQEDNNFIDDVEDAFEDKTMSKNQIENNSTNEPRLTPGMKQFLQVKKENPDCIVLFRMGDFYETFYDDAKIASKILNITLTARGKGEARAPLAGIPYHALDNYLKKLIDANQKVCIVEQLEDPKLAKGLVKRGVTRIITPGTILEENLLTPTNNNYIFSILFDEKNSSTYGLCICDISTGEINITESNNINTLNSEIQKWNPSEIIISKNNLNIFEKITFPILTQNNLFITQINNEEFEEKISIYNLKKYYDNRYEEIQNSNYANKIISLRSLGALLSYIDSKLKNKISYLSIPTWYNINQYMLIDDIAQKDLELVRNNSGNNQNTLYSILNKTNTSMGARLLKKIILQPLMDVEEIKIRQTTIQNFIDNPVLMEELKEELKDISDLQRLGSRLSFGSINPKEIIALKESFFAFEKIKLLLEKENYKNKFKLFENIKNISKHKNIINLIDERIKVEPSSLVREGNIIKTGYNHELDELRHLSNNSKEWLREFEESEREKTKIKSLKVRYNKIFGYFIEVTKQNIHLVPQTYIRKQTQVNSERYITDELKDKEATILGAKERINSLEYQLYTELLEELLQYQETIKKCGNIISLIDCMLSLSTTSVNNNYCKPEIIDEKNTHSKIFKLESSRHPVVEKFTDFISNDCVFGNEDYIHIITGPNMAGKSTYLRQIALIAIMAQIGSFIPAKSATLPLFDKIFTRVGASDNLARGDSTFMVEMKETANILNNATNKSLVILDEIGRGTSTYDGFSLAWAIAEHLTSKIKCTTLFATHYHQLNTMQEKFVGVKNYHCIIDETNNNEIIFLRKIMPGSTDKSYGIHVAKLAGIKDEVIKNAKKIMDKLEKEDEVLKKIKEGREKNQDSLLKYSD